METAYMMDESRALALELRKLPEPLKALEELSWNYWWSWAEDGAAVFRDLAPDVWQECEHNPRRLLRETSDFRLAQMAVDPIYTARVRNLAESFHRYMNSSRGAWASTHAKEITSARPVAYFCAEYGIHHSLPLYSGGLGILAGDHLKSASDLGLPLVAVGLLYRYGYFRQRLTRDGWQDEHYGESHPGDLPIHHLRDENGVPLSISVEMRGRTVYAHVWRANVGRINLYLLDTNIPENDPVDRWVTGHLYGGDRETRIVQEMILGTGGVRLLRRLGIDPSVFHLNEGHSALLTLELAREEITERNVTFDEAARTVRGQCVFTTHTPVAAGNDEFDPALLDRCLGENFWTALRLSRDEFLGIGRVRPGDSSEFFGMTPLAIKMSRQTNGVSRKHEEVSQLLWRELWPEREAEDVPITHITNGVHAPTWVAPNLRALYAKYIGENWTETILDAEAWAKGLQKISDEELWRAHELLKERLIAFIRHRSFNSRSRREETVEYRDAARTMFDPDALTIGFARRVAGYKRWSLLLTDAERLLRLLGNKERPIQFVFAGKAHPQDMGAKVVLQRLAQWKLDPFIMRRAVFLEDYDQEIARQLVQSVDVWLNVPRKPLEASGTSGEKVAMNGGLNLSVLDGWWAEAYDGTNGWSVGHDSDTEEDAATTTEAPIDAEDARDAESLYRVLETEVIPLYYERDANNIPRRWVQMMRRSIETLAPRFNSDRMVGEYAQRIYIDDAKSN
jgi:glycogen phosphorylase